MEAAGGDALHGGAQPLEQQLRAVARGFAQTEPRAAPSWRSPKAAP